MRNEPRTGIIREMLWDEAARAIHYYIYENNVPINEPFTRDDLRHVQPTNMPAEPGRPRPRRERSPRRADPLLPSGTDRHSAAAAGDPEHYSRSISFDFLLFDVISCA